MRYSYEFKVKCVKMYKRGVYPDTPQGISKSEFHKAIRRWVRISDSCGLSSLRHKPRHKAWDPMEKYKLVAQVIAGYSLKDTALRSGINPGMLSVWVTRYNLYGYDGLKSKQGRPPKEPTVSENTEPTPLTESEREELIRLRAESARMKTEIAAIKKEIALREEQGKARLKAKRQRLQKNSKTPDTN